jgi:hypothetical protein
MCGVPYQVAEISLLALILRYPQWVDNSDERDAVEFRISSTNLADSVFTHQHRCMKIMNQVTPQVR